MCKILIAAWVCLVLLVLSHGVMACVCHGEPWHGLGAELGSWVLKVSKKACRAQKLVYTECPEVHVV